MPVLSGRACFFFRNEPISMCRILRRKVFTFCKKNLLFWYWIALISTWSLLCYIYIGCVQRMPAVSISIWPCTCNCVQSSALNSAGAIPWRRPGGKQFVHTLCDRIKGCERMKYRAEPRIWNWCRGGEARKIRHLLLQSNSTPSPWEKHIGL